MTSKKNTLVVKILFGIFMILGLTACNSDNNTIEYESEKYVLLEYNTDIFYYDYNNSSYLEEDVIHPVECDQWKMVIYNGDLFVEKGKHDVAQEYYADDANYDWQVTAENEDEVETYPVTLTDDEYAYIYDMENLEKEMSVFYDEIETFGSLEKVSKDGIIKAGIDLVQVDDAWYWKTELIDENKEEDDDYPEYVQELPASLVEKISDSCDADNLNID